MSPVARFLRVPVRARQAGRYENTGRCCRRHWDCCDGRRLELDDSYSGEQGIHEAPLLQCFPRSLWDVPARNKTITGRTHNAQFMLSILAPLHGTTVTVASYQRPQIAQGIGMIWGSPSRFIRPYQKDLNSPDAIWRIPISITNR